MNSLMMDPHTGDVFDCNGGLRHLREWLLAPASMATTSLTQDPIRCLRYASPPLHNAPPHRGPSCLT